MAGLSQESLTAIIAIISTAVIGMYFLLAAHLRETARKAEHARRVKQLREEYHARLRTLRDGPQEEVIYAEPVEETPPSARKAA